MSQTKIRGSKQIEWDAEIVIGAQLIHTTSAPTDGHHLGNKDYIDNAITTALGGADAMKFKGTVGVGGTYEITAFNALATYEAGWTYRAITAGTIKGKVCKLNDMVVALVDRVGSGNVDADWAWIPTNDVGVVIGPASATDGQMVLFDGTTGKLVKAGVAPHIAATVTTTNGLSISGQEISLQLASASTHGALSDTDWTLFNGKTDLVTVKADTDIASAIFLKHAAATVDAAGIANGLSISGQILSLQFASASQHGALTNEDWNIFNGRASVANYVVREIPTGTKNGSNFTFSLDLAPVSGTEMVFLNGILQDAGAGNDYTISTNIITMAVAPISTDKILVTYWK